MGFAVDVVSVVPHDECAEICYRSEDRVPCPKNHACQTQTGSQELPIASLGPVIGAEHCDLGLT
jgi:hypothetical protein